MISDIFTLNEEDLKNLDAPSIFIVEEWSSIPHDNVLPGDILLMEKDSAVKGIGIVCYLSPSECVADWTLKDIPLNETEAISKEIRKTINSFLR